MAEDRAPGMDHAHYPFRRLPDAPRFTWPGDARIAFTVTLMLDAWEVNPPADASRDPRMVSPLGAFFPDWLTWSQREYGARVGIFRVLEALDAFAITPSVALGAAAAKRYPELVDELLRRNACFMAHGTFATRRITSRMNEADERALIAESREAVRAATGALPPWLVRAGLQQIGAHPGVAGRSGIRLHHRLGQRRPAVFCWAPMTGGRCSRCPRSRNGTTWNAWRCGGSPHRSGPTASPKASRSCTKKAAACST